MALRPLTQRPTGGVSLTGGIGYAAPPAAPKPPAPTPVAKVPTPAAPKAPAAAAPSGAGSNYGYNTTSKAPFDPYASPTTQGQLNQQAIALAAPGYQPQLNQNTADTQAEDAAAKQRVQDISGIYSEYGSQAQQAFQETQQALKDMISQNATGDTNQMGVLSAALNSALGAPNTTGAMMGLSGAVTPGEIAPYQAAAAGSAAGTGQELQALSGGLLSTSGANVGNAALEGAQQKDIESQRHGAALQSLSQSRDAIVQQIPDLIEKAREQLITDILNASGLKFQQQLAAKQFGLSATTEKQNANIANQTLALNKTNSAATRANAAEQLKQNQETIDNNAKSIQASAKLAEQKYNQSIAKIQGTREASAVKFLAGFVQPTKLEIANKTQSRIDPVTGGTITVRAGSVDPTTWYRDPSVALKTLRSAYGLSLTDALSLMSSLDTPIGRGSTQTIGQWATAYLGAIRSTAGQTPGQVVQGQANQAAGAVNKVLAGIFR